MSVAFSIMLDNGENNVAIQKTADQDKCLQ